MTRNLPSGMNDVLHLTRSGDLSGATSMIQHLLSGAPAPEALRSSEQIIELKPQALDRSAAKHRATNSHKSAKGSTSKHSYTGKGGTLAYHLYLPAIITAEMPMVVMLHGCTQSADDFALGTRMNDLAEEFGFAVVYPEQSAGANAQRCWNWFRAGDQRRGGGEPSLIAGLTHKIILAHSIDRSRIYIAGLSAGGAAAANMAAAYPDIYAAVGIHSGLACGSARDMPSAFAAMNGSAAIDPIGDQAFVPTITFHGGRDKTVKPSNSVQIHARFVGHPNLAEAHKVQDRGVSALGRPYVKNAMVNADGRSLSESWTMPDAGHAWSGGSHAGTYTDPHGPDASREMIRFFLQHRLD